MKDRKLFQDIRTAIADYMQSEGCSCCRNVDAHEVNRNRLGKLLRAPKYDDGSGYDFSKFRSENKTKKNTR